MPDRQRQTEGEVLKINPKGKDGPHAKRLGWLKNNNPPGDPSLAPRCGARTRKGTPCKAPAMRNGRCRMHGGCSTGPRTPEGLKRSRQARLIHGEYSMIVRRQRAYNRALLRECREFCKRYP